jgi:hypothetical protein
MIDRSTALPSSQLQELLIRSCHENTPTMIRNAFWNTRTQLILERFMRKVWSDPRWNRDTFTWVAAAHRLFQRPPARAQVVCPHCGALHAASPDIDKLIMLHCARGGGQGEGDFSQDSIARSKCFTTTSTDQPSRRFNLIGENFGIKLA